MKDVDNPPGQARYLRDIIKKYQEPSEQLAATTPSTDAEKRLARLQQALLGYLNKEEEYIRDSDGVYRGQMVSSDEVRKIIKENT